MDMRVYYRKIREVEASLPEDPVVVVSLETPDGGKAGILTEVSRRNAAKLVVEGRVTVAPDEIAAKFRQDARDAKIAAEEKEAARRMEFTFVPAGEKKSGMRPAKV
jgi:hypothetical protein